MFGPYWHTPTQRDNFVRSQEQFRTGTRQDLCGARNGRGEACRRLRLTGSQRCFKHAGPKAHREFAARLEADWRAGKVPDDHWFRFEARRRINKLQAGWRHDPWIAGQTLALGAEEGAFLDALATLGTDPSAISPAALDAARWRYRRTMIDRRRPDDWHEFVAGKLRERIEREGPPPAGWVSAAPVSAPGAPVFKCEPLPASSKRRRLDPLKASKAVGVAKAGQRGRLAKRLARPLGTADGDAGFDLDAVLLAHWKTLRPIMEGLGLDTGDREIVGRFARAFSQTAMRGDHQGWIAALAWFRDPT
jgi:hypothetical protein